jgi:drug/metabolite transporter (DMT)-like permease
MTQRSAHLRSPGLLAATAVLWSFGGVLIKSVAWNPVAIAGMRSLIALPFLFLVSRKTHVDGSLPQIGGAVAYTATVLLFVSATKLTTAANAILLQYTAPVWVALFSHYFLKERVTALDWLAIIVTLAGMFLFFIDRLSSAGMLGNILAVLSGIAFASLVCFMRHQKDASPMGSVFLGNVLTAVFAVPFMLHPMHDPRSWSCLGLLGVFQIGLSYVLYSAAIRHVSALEAILVPVIEPILNPIWVLWVVGETPGKWALIGGVIVIAAVLVRSWISIGPKTSRRTSAEGRNKSDFFT